jgi:hypothetical protein
MAAQWRVCVTTQVLPGRPRELLFSSTLPRHSALGISTGVYQFEISFHKLARSQAWRRLMAPHFLGGDSLSFAEVRGCCRIHRFQMAAIPFMLLVLPGFAIPFVQIF